MRGVIPRDGRGGDTRGSASQPEGSGWRSGRRRPEHPDPWRELRRELARGDPQVVLGLQVEPEPGLHREEHAESQCGVGGDGAVAVHDLADAARRHVDVGRQLPGRDAERLQVVLEQDLAGCESGVFS